MTSRQDSTPLIMDKVAQWIGRDPGNLNITHDDILNRIVFVGNATARMQVPVHPHGYWRGGTVGYKPDAQILFSQTSITKSGSKSGQSITAGTGFTAYTVTANKTLYMTDLQIGSGANNQFEIRDGSGGTLLCSGIILATTTYPIHFTFPLPFTNSVFIDVTTTQTEFWAFQGFEEET